MDTNVIIEAHRTKCRGAVVNIFKVETVEKCREEAATGDKRRVGYVVIDVEAMEKTVLIHPVTVMELAELETRLAEPDRIDAGEKHLLAHALKKAAVWHVSASDRAAVRAGNELRLLDKFVSLEALARVAGMSPKFKNHFTERWLSALRTEIIMGAL